MNKLKKHICKKCLNEYVEKEGAKEVDGEDLLWGKQNDFIWEQGRVFCKIYENDMKFEDIEMNKCPYVLEQTVLEDDK